MSDMHERSQMLPRDCLCVSLFDPLTKKFLLPDKEGEPIIPPTLFSPLVLSEWLSIFLALFYQQKFPCGNPLSRFKLQDLRFSSQKSKSTEHSEATVYMNSDSFMLKTSEIH